MEDLKFWLTLLGGPGIGAVGAWAVMREKVQRIDTIEPKITALEKDVAVLQSKQEDHEKQIDGFLEAIQAMEKRIVEQVKQLFEAFSRGGRA